MTSDEATRKLVKVLDPDSEGALPPEVIEELKKEVEAAGENVPTEPRPHSLTEQHKSRPSRRERPILREKIMRPRRLRIQRRDGEITIDEVD